MRWVVSDNTVLCDVEITPDGAVVVIEDVGARGIPGTYVHQDIDVDPGASRHALWVHTMSFHECATIGRGIRVQVLAGTDTRGLGVCAFDGPLTIASGVLAVGDSRNPQRQILFGSPTVLRVRVFLGNQVDGIRFNDPPGGEYPVSGPSEVNVLLPADHGFAHAVANTGTRRSWIGWLARRRRL